MGDTQSHIILFNDERYQRCNLRPGQRLFRYDHVAGGRLVGTLSGVIEDGLLDCGHSAPFGGVDFCRPRAAVSEIVGLLEAARRRARDDGVREMRVRARPGYFGANETAVVFALLNLGALVETCELSLGLETCRFATAEQYLAALGDSARNMVRQGIRAETAFGPAQSPREWAECYDLLAATKCRKGVSFKLAPDYLARLRETFPKRIAMYRLVKDRVLAAAALVYRVGRNWDYVAAWGDEPEHRRHRPMNLMSFEIFRIAITDRVQLVDLGISSVDGVPDDGLIQFKRSLGAASGLRLNLRLTL
jgi:hypothetical protein